MRTIKRLPVYATGVGFTAALVAVAEARHWSGGVLLLAALGVGAFYVVTILVPWLIREQIAAEEGGQLPRARRRLVPLLLLRFRLRFSYYRAGAATVGADDLADKIDDLTDKCQPPTVVSVELRRSNGALVPAAEGDQELLGMPSTHGSRTIRPSEPQFAGR